MEKLINEWMSASLTWSSSSDKAFDHAIKLTKGKTTYRTSVIASKHKENISIPAESVKSFVLYNQREPMAKLVD